MFDGLSVNKMFDLLSSDRATRAILVVVTPENELIYLGVADGEKTNDPAKMVRLLESTARTLAAYRQ